MEQEFGGKTALVTGAAGALGKVVTARLASAGAHVVGLAREAGGGHVGVDLSDAAATRTAIDRIAGESGRIDVVCHIAGAFAMGESVDQLATGREWRAMMDANVVTLLNLVAASVPHLKRQGGAVVTVGAVSALSGKARMGAYVAAKSAVMRLTESLALELRDSGINVNAVLPSVIDTPTNRRDMPKADPRRWVTSEDLAEVIAFLASPRAKAIHGALVPVVGLT